MSFTDSRIDDLCAELSGCFVLLRHRYTGEDSPREIPVGFLR